MKKDGRDEESKMPIYRYGQWQQRRWIKANGNRGPEIHRRANGGCARNPRSNDLDNLHLLGDGSCEH